MKTYVLTISKYFPKGHMFEGMETGFVDKIATGRKIHTIRSNYELWRKRIEKIEAGNACLSLRFWEGKPYKSKQFEFARLTKAWNKIGLQKIVIGSGFPPMIDDVADKELLSDIAKNDGLSFIEFLSWFQKYDRSKPMALIHFTGFRYI